MIEREAIEKLFLALPTISDYHSPDTLLYGFLKDASRKEIEKLFKNKKGKIGFYPFGKIIFPYHKMGAIDSLNLFDLDELIIFSYYWRNRSRYKKVLDIGANLGLHSIILSKCGYNVSCYEPDPLHFKILLTNIKLNGIKNVTPYNMAVSNKESILDFIRVLGNTTGSHIAGAKKNPYGKLEKISVATADFRKIITGFDLIKMDVEGHEKEIICSTQYNDWKNSDGMLSVHDEVNAKALFEHFSKLKVNLFSQKINWKKVNSWKDIPGNHYEGSLFASIKKEMCW